MIGVLVAGHLLAQMLTGGWGPGPRAQGIWAIALVDLILLAFPRGFKLSRRPKGNPGECRGVWTSSADECGKRQAVSDRASPNVML